MNQNTIDIEILPDGTIKSTTSPISGPVHSSAESFFADIRRATGGEEERQRRGHAHHHAHHHHHEEKKA